MHLPILPKTRAFMESRDVFLGLNHNLRLSPGEFYQMENLTSDLFPVLSPRESRSILKEAGDFNGLADRDGLCWVDGENLYLNGKKLDLRLDPLPEGQVRQLISMGAYLIILPDKKYVNTSNIQDRGSMEAEFVSSAPVHMSQCDLAGHEITPAFKGPDTPQDPTDHSYWLDFDKGELKQYSQSSNLWVVMETPYVKLSCPTMGRGFSSYDGVTVSGDPALKELSGSAVIHDCGDDFIIIPGLIRENLVLRLPVTVSRKIPRMDFCMESGNRLWGCRYGPDDYGRVVNEIYCSKLGDFKNFHTYLGISTDSYTVSLGSEGPFTGAVSYGGYPLFFKENCLHKVFGTMPSNFSVQTTACRGVAPGCSRSLAICREVLYYKASDCICAYDGSLPREISQALGKTRYKQAVAGTVNGKYYVSMEKEKGWDLLVFDSARGLWHREDDLQAKLFCTCHGELICADSRGRLLGLTGALGEQEKGPVSWMAESGLIGVNLPGNKYLSRLSFRIQLEPGSSVTVRVQYDSRGPFEDLGTVRGMELKSFVFPVVPRRCDHLRLRLEGRGKALLYSVTRVLKPGSDGGI